MRASQSALHTLIAMFIAFFVFLPVLWIILGAVKDRGRVIRNPLGLPDIWHWENFRSAWVGGNFSTYFTNSILVVIPVVFAILALSLLAAEACA